MDTISLKEWIFKNNKIETVLNEIGCKYIEYHANKNYYSCSNYNGDNKTAVNVKNNKYLNVTNWTREKEFDDGSDIITLVEYNKKLSFIDAVKYLHKIFKLNFKYEKKSEIKDESTDILEVFRKHEASIMKNVDVNDLQFLDEELIDDYIPIPFIGWYREGVMPWTVKKFGIAYSYKRSRVIIPMRYWLTGELLGINSRTTIENYDVLGIKKFYITPSYPKGLNLYGLYENREAILKAGYVVVYEAEKSVLKRDSRNDSTGVALSGHTMSNEQWRILFGLNVDIIIAMDKDIHIDEVRNMCEKLYNKRNVYYIYDKYDLLGAKDSLADAPKKVFDYLMQHKIKYDEKEHNKYLASVGGMKLV